MREINTQVFPEPRVSCNSSEDCPRGCRWCLALPDAREDLSSQKSLCGRFSKCGVSGAPALHLSSKHRFSTQTPGTGIVHRHSDRKPGEDVLFHGLRGETDMTHDALAWEERPLQVCHLLHRSLTLDIRARVGWAEGVLSKLHATPSVGSGGSAAIGHGALGKIPPSNGPRLPLGILLKCSF